MLPECGHGAPTVGADLLIDEVHFSAADAVHEPPDGRYFVYERSGNVCSRGEEFRVEDLC